MSVHVDANCEYANTILWTIIGLFYEIFMRSTSKIPNRIELPATLSRYKLSVLRFRTAHKNNPWWWSQCMEILMPVRMNFAHRMIETAFFRSFIVFATGPISADAIKKWNFYLSVKIDFFEISETEFFSIKKLKKIISKIWHFSLKFVDHVDYCNANSVGKVQINFDWPDYLDTFFFQGANH